MGNNKNSLPSYYEECIACANKIAQYFVPDFKTEDLRIFSDRGKGHELMANATPGMQRSNQLSV